jgi:hypothetical protein
MDEAIAKMRAGLDFVAGLAQFLNPRPDRRAADGEFFRKLRAGNAAGIGAERGKDFGVSRHFL